MRNNIKVIFDTNLLRSEPERAVFFGFRSDLEKFAAIAEIVVPDMVIDEIKCQKREHFTSKRDAFASNPFHDIFSLDKSSTKFFDVHTHVNGIYAQEPISHSVIYLTKPDALERIKELCNKRLPPFESGGDKGFKDAYIYLTVLEYLEGITDEQVFFVSGDGKLKEAIKQLKGIIIVSNFEEFEEFNISVFKEEYFINKLKEEISDQITPESIVDVSSNIDGNWILKIDGVEYVDRILVDFKSREILDPRGDFDPFLNRLINAGSFQTVHEMIGELTHYRGFFSDKEVLKLLSSAITNDQIYQIAQDEDVRAFFLDLYSIKKQLLNTEEQEEFEAYFLK
ncbi:PIN domain-containing protein [Patescibacteria group bacterium]|nr:PIN domain-containing protein [Patescibacteria group bacterium]